MKEKILPLLPNQQRPPSYQIPTAWAPKSLPPAFLEQHLDQISVNNWAYNSVVNMDKDVLDDSVLHPTLVGWVHRIMQQLPSAHNRHHHTLVTVDITKTFIIVRISLLCALQITFCTWWNFWYSRRVTDKLCAVAKRNWNICCPTNNALLTNFRLSSNRRNFINKHRRSIQICAKRPKTCLQCVRTYSNWASILHTTVGGWVRSPCVGPLNAPPPPTGCTEHCIDLT